MRAPVRLRRATAAALMTTLLSTAGFGQTPPRAPAPPAAKAPAASAPAAAPPAPAAAPSPAKPLSESLTGMAKAEYEAGRILYEEGDFAGALVKFRASYEHAKDPRLLWNMAACERGLRRYARVYALVQRYQTEAAGTLSSADQQEAESVLGAMKPFVGWLKISVDQADAAVEVDGERVATTPLSGPVLVDIGTRQLKISKPGFVPALRTIEVSGGGALAGDVAREKDVHEGRLVIFAGPGDAIEIDGRVVGVGQFDGTLPSGSHRIRVTARGMRPYQSEVVVSDNQRANLRVALEPAAVTAAPGADRSNTTWLWIAGGVVAAAGLGVGAYFLFRGEDEESAPVTPGTLDPGSVTLSF